MRSRVTANDCPTSSNVCSLPSSSPNRILMTFSSRGVSVFSTEEVCSFKLRLITASDGETTALSSMKSPRCESSSSPIGVSSEIGSWAIFMILRTFAPACPSARRSSPPPAPAPPPRVRGELVAAAVLELLDRLHQTDVPFLNEVEELQAAVRVLLGDGDDEAEVGDDQLLLGLIGFLFALADLADGLLQLLVRGAVEGLQLLELLLVLLQTAAVEVAAGLVLLALVGLLVLADHRQHLRQLAVDVLQLVDHPVARLRREVDAAQLVGELGLEPFHRLLRLLERALGELLRIFELDQRVLDLLVVLGHALE